MYLSDKHIINNIESSIEDELTRVGLFFRIFTRVKAVDSINHKLKEKQTLYSNGSRKMQDVFGLRIILYFNDDVDTARLVVTKMFRERSQDNSIDELEDEKFAPTKYNVIYDLPDEHINVSAIIKHSQYIDNTFEVQYRTILSEGWHEVEHDLRYKCKHEWKDYSKQSRSLNGIFATLENTDLSMIHIFNDLSYLNYKNREWNALVRNTLRLRFVDSNLPTELLELITNEPSIGKSILNLERTKFLQVIINSGYDLPITQANIVFFINRAFIKNDALTALENETLKFYFDRLCL